MDSPHREEKLAHYRKVMQEIIEPTVMIHQPYGRIVFTNDAFNRFFKQNRITTVGKELDNVLGTQIIPRLNENRPGNFSIHYSPQGNTTEGRNLIVSCVWIEKRDYGLLIFFDFGKAINPEKEPEPKPDLRSVRFLHKEEDNGNSYKENYDRAEDILQVQYEILNALQKVSNTQESLNEILEAICRIKGILNCAVYTFTDSQKLRLLSSCQRTEAQNQFPPTISRRAIPGELKSDEGEQHFFPWQHSDVPANHLIPMLSEERPIGIIAIQIEMKAVGTLTLDTLLVFTNWIASFIDRDSSRRQLHETMHNYRALMDNMNEGMVIIDRDERFTLVNRKLCEMTGYSEEDYLGSKIWDFFEPSMMQKVNRMRDERPQMGDRKYEITIVKKNGERIWLTISPTTIRDLSGNPNGVMAIVTDITYYIKVVTGFSFEHGDILDVLMNVSNLSIFSFDAIKNKVEFANDTAISLYGFTYEELYSLTYESMMELVHPEDRSLLRNFFFEAEENNQKLTTTTLAYRIRTKFNDYRWLSSNLIVQKNEQGVMERIFSSAIDINDYRHTSERLDEQYIMNRILFENNPLPMLIVQDPTTIHKLKKVIYEKNVDPNTLIESNLGEVKKRLDKMEILEVNQACLRLFDMKHAQEMMSSFYLYVTLDMIEAIRKSLIAYLIGSSERWFPACTKTKAGKPIEIEIFINPVEFQENSLVIALRELKYKELSCQTN